MEEDDEFGDLYTDVLKPFTLTQSSAPQPHQPSPEPASISRQIDLNLKINDINQTLLPSSSEMNENKDVLAREVEFGDKDVKFDIEDDMGDEPVIPGLSGANGVGELGLPEQNGGVLFGSGGSGDGEGDDWDSDSEDDLQIVLNDDNRGPMGMDRGGMVAEDGDSLVIAADNEANRAMEEQEWGEDAGQGGEGDRKEGEAAKGSGGMVVAPKMGYSAHGFHPYSQFKYVRPGATPIPASTAAASGGPTCQVRPPFNVGSIGGRGRGATGMRPPMQKGFNPSYGMPVWGAGRGFGGGLDFTLPSHKTIFEVDIDSFEEKPWKYPGVDISDFFNFGLNEETWKEYSKQLEQLRLESTMQSRIRVIDSGRTDQEYDPDMPPELAAATGVLDISAENGNLGKTGVGQNEQGRVSARFRPPIPTGRAIQVENGYGERLPSIDTRPPRIRDSDAIIEIVCQDNLDDNSSTGNEDSDCPENDLATQELSGGNLPEEKLPDKNEVSGGFQQTFDCKNREIGSKKQIMNSIHDGKANEGRMSSFPPKSPDHDAPASNKNQSYSGGRLRSSLERPIAGGRSEMSPHSASGDGTYDDHREEPVESSRDDKHVFVSPSPVTSLAEQESSGDHKVAADDEPVTVSENFRMKNEEFLDARDTNDNAGGTTSSQKKLKTTSQTGQQALQESDGEDSKAARSSDNSKGRSGSSREYQKWPDNTEEEVVQVGHNKHMGRVKRPIDENEERVRRRDRYVRPEMERSHMVVRGREDFHSRRDLDRSSIHHLHMNNESFDRRKERNMVDGSLQRIEDGTQIRRTRNEDARKRERGEEVGPWHRGKARESERSRKEEHSLSRNQLDNGPYRGHYDKEVSSRPRERDGSMKIRYEMDDYNSKRRKDDDYIRRDYIDKEEIWHGQRENISRRKRDRDDIVDQWKRDEPARIRENLDDHQSLRHREEGWLQRDRGDRRERDEWHKLKQAHEENILKREKEEGRASMRSGRVVEDKAWGVHARMKDECRSSDRGYQFKDPVRHGEHHRGRDESYTRGNLINYEEKKSRRDRSNSRNDHVVEAFDNPRGQGKRHKENSWKVKEPESGTCNTSSHPRKTQDDQSVRVTETVKGNTGQGNCNRGAPVHRHPSSKQREDASSDDDQQETKRGRSKLERWTSHKERDFSVNSKSTSSLNIKEIDVTATGGSIKSDKFPDGSAKSVEAIMKEHPLSEPKDTVDPQSQDTDKNPVEDKHMDTVEKLKKRSERFKLPMPREKETQTVKRIETEATPSAKIEPLPASEIKQERPARKRRWTGN